MAHDEVDPLSVLKDHCDHYRTQSEAATALEISDGYLSGLIKGNKGFSDRILDKLGLRRIVVKK